VILPFAVLVAGLAPSAISFAAGQAAFTTTLLVLYNVLLPAAGRSVSCGSRTSPSAVLSVWPSGFSSGRAARPSTSGVRWTRLHRQQQLSGGNRCLRRRMLQSRRNRRDAPRALALQAAACIATP